MKLRHRLNEGGSPKPKPKPEIKKVKGDIRRSLRPKPIGENSANNKKPSQSSTPQTDKNSRPKRNGLDDSESDRKEDDESDDEGCGLRDLIETFNNETPEGQNLIDKECELKFECNACGEFFLWFPEFIIHKAGVCRVLTTTNGKLDPFLKKEVLVDVLDKVVGDGTEDSDEENDLKKFSSQTNK